MIFSKENLKPRSMAMIYLVVSGNHSDDLFVSGQKHRMLLQPQGIFTQGDGEVMFNLSFKGEG